MSKEQQYKQQLIDLGVYSPAFDAEIHTLCILERELSRTMKAWKATAPPGGAPLATDPLYDVIAKQRRDILTHRDALGLTPKGLQRLRRQAPPTGEAAAPVGTSNPALNTLLDGIRGKVNGSAP